MKTKLKLDENEMKSGQNENKQNTTEMKGKNHKSKSGLQVDVRPHDPKQLIKSIDEECISEESLR